MKHVILIVMLGLVSVMSIGCSPESMSALAGGVGLTATARILDDLGNTTAREKALLLANRVSLQEELQQTQDVVRQKEIETLIAENEHKDKLLGTASAGLATAKLATKTDWTDPEQAAPWGAAAGSMALAWLMNKKKKSAEDVLKDFNGAVTEYMAESQPAEAEKLNTKINGGRKKIPV